MSIEKQVRILRAYVVILTVMLGGLSLVAFRQATQNTKFTEIDVQRINIVEPDGKLRLVISNRPRSSGPIYKGKPFGYAGGDRPGIIFFNDEGTENGGLTFSGRRGADGRYQAVSGFSFDQFNQDQIFYFQYRDDNGQRNTGLTIADRTDADIFDLVTERDSINKIADSSARAAALTRWAQPRNGVPLFAQRLYLGRDRSKASVVTLSDRNGKVRLRMMVDSSGTPSLEFLDANGVVTARLPEARR